MKSRYASAALLLGLCHIGLGAKPAVAQYSFNFSILYLGTLAKFLNLSALFIRGEPVRPPCRRLKRHQLSAVMDEDLRATSFPHQRASNSMHLSPQGSCLAISVPLCV
jgi:hypothetical protein